MSMDPYESPYSDMSGVLEDPQWLNKLLGTTADAYFQYRQVGNAQKNTQLLQQQASDLVRIQNAKLVNGPTLMDNIKSYIPYIAIGGVSLFIVLYLKKKRKRK